MAREPHAREDFLRDAAALSPRLLLRRRDDAAHEVFAGFRGDCLSLYFDDDPVFHFNSAGELRRAYVDGRLIKADQGRLAALRREPRPTTSDLLRTDMNASLQQTLLDDIERRLCELTAALSNSKFTIAGQIPDDASAIERLHHWLHRRSPIHVAQSPRID